eukprot:CFRG5015T1
MDGHKNRAAVLVEAFRNDQKIAHYKVLMERHSDFREVVAVVSEGLDLAMGKGSATEALRRDGGLDSLDPDFHRNFFVNVLPNMVYAGLQRGDVEYPVLQKTMYMFLRNTLQSAISRLQIMSKELKDEEVRQEANETGGVVEGAYQPLSPLAMDSKYLESLVALVSFTCDHESPFYDISTYSQLDNSDDGQYQSIAEMFLYDNDGVLLVHQMCTPPSCTLRTLYHAARLCTSMNDFFDLGHVRDQVVNLVILIMDRLLASSHQKLKADMQLTNELRNMVMSLGKALGGDGYRQELFELDLAMKFVQSPYIEQRLQGITVLRGYASFFLKNHSDVRRRGSDGMGNVGANLKSWFESHDLIMQVFGANAHSEIISRCGPILRFLALSNSLSESNLQTLVGGVQAHHESVRLAIFSVVIEMVFAVRNPPVFECLFGLLEGIPLSEWDSLLLDFVCKCAIAALRQVTNHFISPRPRYGLRSIWQIIVNERSLSRLLVSGAVDHFIEILKCPQNTLLRFDYLLECVQAINSGTSVTTVCLVLRRLVAECELNVGGEEIENINGSVVNDGAVTESDSMLYECTSYADVLVFLQNEYKIIDLVVDSVERYLQRLHRPSIVSYTSVSTSTAAPAAAPAASPRTAPISVSTHSFYTPNEEISTRLSLLGSLLFKSGGRLVLNREHLDALWRCCQTSCVDPITEEPYGEQVLLWLDELVGDSNTVFTPESGQFLFEERVGTTPATMSHGEFKLLTTLFVQINYTGEILRKEPLGMDRLWFLALTTKSDSLSYKIHEFVIALYSQFDLTNSKSPRLSLARRHEFIGRCMRCVAMTTIASNQSNPHIIETAKNVATATEQFTLPEILSKNETGNMIPITRALTMLSRYLKMYEAANRDQLASLGLSREGHIFEGKALRLNVEVQQKSVFQISVVTVNTVGNLRDIIRAHIGDSVASMRMLMAGRELKDAHKTLAQENVKTDAHIQVLLTTPCHDQDSGRPSAPQPHTHTSKHESFPVSRANDVPMVMLAGTPYFDLLFALLRLDTATFISDLWALVVSLPHNVRTYYACVDLDRASPSDTVGSSWRLLLDPSSPYQLLYILSIMSLLMDQCVQTRERDQRYRCASSDVMAMDTSPGSSVAELWDDQFEACGGVAVLHDILESVSRWSEKHTHKPIYTQTKSSSPYTKNTMYAHKQLISVKLLEKMLKMLFYFTMSCEMVMVTTDTSSAEGGTDKSVDVERTHKHSYHQSYRPLSLQMREMNRESIDNRLLCGDVDLSIGGNACLEAHTTRTKMTLCIEGREVPGNETSFLSTVVDILQFIVGVSGISSDTISNDVRGSMGVDVDADVDVDTYESMNRGVSVLQDMGVALEDSVSICMMLIIAVCSREQHGSRSARVSEIVSPFRHVLERMTKGDVENTNENGVIGCQATGNVSVVDEAQHIVSLTPAVSNIPVNPRETRVDNVLSRLLIDCSVIEIRNEAAVGLRLLSDSLSGDDKEQMLDVLTSLLLLVPDDSRQCHDIFDLMSAVVRALPNNHPCGEGSAMSRLMSIAVSRLRNHPALETHRSAEPDVLLGCLLQLLGNVVAKGGLPLVDTNTCTNSTHVRTSLIAKNVDRSIACRTSYCENNRDTNICALATFIHKECLFSIPTLTNKGPHAPPLCKTAISRSTARALLDVLGSVEKVGSCVRHQLCSLLMHTHFPKYITKTHAPACTGTAEEVSTPSAMDTSGGDIDIRGDSNENDSVNQNVPIHAEFDCGCNDECDSACAVACHEGLVASSGWGRIPRLVERSACGFVGLENLGATCYLNSLMQNLFMVPDFRRGILSTKARPWDSTPPAPHALVLYQLQTLFAYLQESLLKSYNAQGFCSVYESEGACLDTNLQMDVDEFFNVLFDRLETLLKESPEENLLKDTFGEREQVLFSIQCDVVNKRSVRESLEMYVKGEMLEGDNKYYCDKCDLKVDAEKRVSVYQLPNHLIFHLKRFEFDMELMRRIKVNDRYEFPAELDMYPYTLEGITAAERAEKGLPSQPRQHSKEHYIYDLSGILVHKGNADSGHYYSIISDREIMQREGKLKGEARGGDGKGGFGGRWMLFDDSNVREFDPQDIPDQTYGGHHVNGSSSGGLDQNFSRTNSAQSQYTDHNSGKPILKNYSAYMLFYVNRKPVPTDTTTTMVEWIPSHKFVPCHILRTIWRHNTRFSHERMLFESAHFSWVWKLTGGTTSKPICDLPFIQLRTIFFLMAVLRSGVETGWQERWFESLILSFKASPAACAWFARWIMKRDDDLPRWLMTNEIERPDDLSRLIVCAVSVLRNSQPNTEDETPMQVDKVETTSHSDVAFDLLNFISTLASCCQQYRGTCGAYLRLLCTLVREGDDVAKALLRDDRVIYGDVKILDKEKFDNGDVAIGLLADLVTLYIGKDVPTRGSEMSELLYIPSLITCLCQFYSPPCPDTHEETVTGPPFPMSTIFGEDYSYLIAVLRYHDNLTTLQELVTRTCKYNYRLAQKIVSVCQQAIPRTTHVAYNTRQDQRSRSSCQMGSDDCDIHTLIRAVLSTIYDCVGASEGGASESESVSAGVSKGHIFRNLIHSHLETLASMVPRLLINAQMQEIGQESVKHVLILSDTYGNCVLEWLFDHYRSWLLQWVVAAGNHKHVQNMILSLSIKMIGSDTLCDDMATRMNKTPLLPLPTCSALDADFMSQIPESKLTQKGSALSEMECTRIYLQTLVSAFNRKSKQTVQGKSLRKRQGDGRLNSVLDSPLSSSGSSGSNSRSSPEPDMPSSRDKGKKISVPDDERSGASDQSRQANLADSLNVGAVGAGRVYQSDAVKLSAGEEKKRVLLFCYCLENAANLVSFFSQSPIDATQSDRFLGILRRGLLGYFRLISGLYPAKSVSEAVVRCILTNIEAFSSLVWEVDSTHTEMDPAKLEGMSWWLTVCCHESYGSACVNKFFNHETAGHRKWTNTMLMQEFFISINTSSEQAIAYNDQMLCVFYRFVRLLCCYSNEFIASWCQNSNFFWAVGYVLTSKMLYPKAMAELVHVVEYVSTCNADRLAGQQRSPPRMDPHVFSTLKATQLVHTRIHERVYLQSRINLMKAVIENGSLDSVREQALLGVFVLYAAMCRIPSDSQYNNFVCMYQQLKDPARGIVLVWRSLIKLVKESMDRQRRGIMKLCTCTRAHAQPRTHAHTHTPTTTIAARARANTDLSRSLSNSIDIDESNDDGVEVEVAIQCSLDVVRRIIQWVLTDLIPANPAPNTDPHTIIRITRETVAMDTHEEHPLVVDIMSRWLCLYSGEVECAYALSPTPTLTHTLAHDTECSGSMSEGVLDVDVIGGVDEYAVRTKAIALIRECCELSSKLLTIVRRTLLSDHMRMQNAITSPDITHTPTHSCTHTMQRLGFHLGCDLVYGHKDAYVYTSAQRVLISDYCDFVHNIIILSLNSADHPDTAAIVKESLRLNQSVAMGTVFAKIYQPHTLWPNAWIDDPEAEVVSLRLMQGHVNDTHDDWEEYCIYVLAVDMSYLRDMPMCVLGNFAALVRMVMHDAGVSVKETIASSMERAISGCISEASDSKSLMQVYKALCVCAVCPSLHSNLDVATSIAVLQTSNTSSHDDSSDFVEARELANRLAALL